MSSYGINSALAQQYKRLETFEKQCYYLNLTPDAYVRIRRFSSKIIKTCLFSNMENLDASLRIKSNPEKRKAYNSLVNDVKIHLRRKMSIIENLETKENRQENKVDLWLQHRPDSTDVSFYEASLHLDDILFSCEELGKYELQEFISLQLSDLDAYKKELELKYTPLLTSEDECVEQAKKIATKVDALREAIQNQEFSRVGKICATIREIAKLS